MNIGDIEKNSNKLVIMKDKKIQDLLLVLVGIFTTYIKCYRIVLNIMAGSW